ncbi:HAD-like domain protein [Moelleriella libera RCEF 2490]|uniref:HAD-like domain protein n=1 Tax=Moelleriella libera RCEF 2490 TaxID=1081109 RepID=A0A167YTU1_9HYPO|nr:HAD-like domain protein [Moelleriella libera RCEF 2490]
MDTETNSVQKIVVFDFERCVIDDYHSRQCAAAFLRRRWRQLSETVPSSLVDACERLFPVAHRLRIGEQTQDPEVYKTSLARFLEELGVEEPESVDPERLRINYAEAYLGNRRPIAGCVHAFVRLRENGYAIGIVSRLAIRRQQEYARAMGLQRYISFMWSSEHKESLTMKDIIQDLAGTKPTTGPVDATCVAGAVEDIAPDGWEPWPRSLLYLPLGQQRPNPCHEMIKVVRFVKQVPNYLGIGAVGFNTRFGVRSNQLRVGGLGIDLLTVPHDDMHFLEEDIRDLVDGFERVLSHVAQNHLLWAMEILGGMIGTVVRATRRGMETQLDIVLPHHDDEEPPTDEFSWTTVERAHSMAVRSDGLVLNTASQSVLELARIVAKMMQLSFDELMRTCPAAAVRRLRAVLLNVAEVEGVREQIAIRGHGVDSFVGSDVRFLPPESPIRLDTYTWEDFE